MSPRSSRLILSSKPVLSWVQTFPHLVIQYLLAYQTLRLNLKMRLVPRVTDVVVALCLSALGLSLPSLETQELSLFDRQALSPLPGPPSCNKPNNRACWAPGFNINTDYEKKIPKGKLVQVRLPSRH